MNQLKSTLYPFQRDSVERAKDFNGRCLLALEQGLGKSLVAATYIMETNSFPAIVVCPASLKYNWAQEFWKHYGKKVTILSGTKPKKFGPLSKTGDKIFIINYDVVYAWLPQLKSLNPEIVVLDESQMVKTLGARRTQACAELAFQATKMLALSGTPMVSNPLELYTTLNMLFKGHMVSKWQFMNRYTNWFKGPYGIKVTGPKNEVELNTFLNNRCMIRHRAEEVLPDLPPYIRQSTLLEMTSTQRREYEKLQESFAAWLKERYPDRRVPQSEQSAIMAQFGYMKRRVAEWKIPAIIEHIHNFIDGDSGKLIVFGLHRKILDAIWDVFSKQNGKNPFIVRLDGTSTAIQRHEAVHHFQNDPYTRVFLGQIQAAGVGLTLTASNHSLFAELDFSSIAHEQAEKRNLRIGTKAAFVHYNYLLMRDTIEERVATLLFQKSHTIAQVIDGKFGIGANTASFNIVSDLLRDHLAHNFGA